MDVVITSSSRPECLKRTVESFLDKAEYSGSFRFIVHEDYVFPAMSQKIKRWVDEFAQQKNLSFLFLGNDPPVYIGNAMAELISRVGSDFFFYLQDDLELERAIPLDDVIGIMKNYEDINQIMFYGWRLKDRIGTIDDKKFFIKYPERKVCTLDSKRKYIICAGWRWGAAVGVWRTSWAMGNRHLIKGEKQIQSAKFRAAFHPRQTDLILARSKVGSYFWGPKGDYRYLKHTGTFLRMYIKDDGLPGINPGATMAEIARVDSEYKAPWVEARSVPTREEWIKEYEDELRKTAG